MKLKRTLMVFLGIMFMILPTIVDAVCEDHSADTCPEGVCKVENNVCVNAYVGENVCEEENVKSALTVVGYFVFTAKILVPFVIIGFGIFDLTKAVTSGQGDVLGKQIKVLGIRVLIGFLIFFLPTIISAIVNAAGNFDSEENGFTTCFEYVVSPFGKKERGCSSKTDFETCYATKGCAWNGKTCVTKTESCSSYTFPELCTQHEGCRWSGNTCVADVDPCSSYTFPDLCTQQEGCRWSGNTCITK